MRLRTQLALAFFLLAVVPLLGVTIFTYWASLRAYRRAVIAEAEALAADMSARAAVVEDELSMRIQRMRQRPRRTAEGSFERARREALAAAQQQELRVLLRTVLSGAERQQGAIPFAHDAEGRLYTPAAEDEKVLEGLGVVPGRPITRGDAADWVLVLRPDPESGVVIGVARPLGEPLQDIRRTTARNLGLGLGLAALALLGILPLSRRMTRHLGALTEGAERLGRGDLDVRVSVPRSLEFARLAETFNRMARDLRRNQEQRLEQERIRKELEIGRRIQEELLPRAPLRSSFAEIGGASVPAREVGGDFFNYFPLPEGEVAVLLGDVSGKGVGAALLMASLQATLRARLALEPDLAKLVDDLDRELGGDEPLAPYVTLFLAVLEGEAGRLRYVNAGHNTQLVRRRDGDVERLVSSGRPPGLYPGGGYVQEAVALGEGDGLFLFTDGVVEAEDESGEPFGMERLEAILTVHRGDELAALVAHVHEAVRAHRGPREADDDATLLALRAFAGPSARAST
jgi:sigma-B regulation protein RsbU (phosphoserine phosphatase)